MPAVLSLSGTQYLLQLLYGLYTFGLICQNCSKHNTPKNWQREWFQFFIHRLELFTQKESKGILFRDFREHKALA
jgi:hypothetical protein